MQEESIIVADLMKTIDQLEEVHQTLKVEYLDWAYNRFPGDHGIGSGRNPQTVEFLKSNANYTNEICSLRDQVLTGISALSDPMQKYCAYREIYFIHPSFHERWFFDDHIHYLANILFIGRHGFGLNTFLAKHEQSPSRLEGIATFSLKRALLLENILSGHLRTTLSDYDPISDAKISEYQKDLKIIADPKCSPAEIASLMPQVFEVLQTLLKKTDNRVLEYNKLLSVEGWLNYAPCAINEGPIFHKKSSESRVNIFKKIPTTHPDELRNELEKYFEIQIVRPFDGMIAPQTLS